MTHIYNIEHILTHGITHRNSPNANNKYKSIGDNTLISTRNIHPLDNGKSIGDYIPFYFGVRTPMLYVIIKGFNGVSPTPSESIVYCVTSIQQILDSDIDFIFTDGHAVDSFSSKYSKEQIIDIDNILDYSAINATHWKDENDLDKKRRKEAEFLLECDLPSKYILGYICYNEKAKVSLISLGISENKIVIKPDFYF
ncbi:type II toxin-antitoxin system toxin DNA ADP-ribosyl transferase DarT [Emticicia soli]